MFLQTSSSLILAASNDEPPHDATPIEAEQTNDPDPLEVELIDNPLEMGLDALLLACRDMYKLNTETEPSVKCLRLKLDQSAICHHF